MAFSAPYRADPSQVPFFPPVPGGLFEVGGRGQSGADARSGQSGIRWMLRTSGLILLCFIGVGAVIGGGAGILGSHAEGTLKFAAGVAMLGFVIWVMVRRYRLHKL